MPRMTWSACQYSLKGLLAFVALLAVILGTLLSRAESQRKAIHAVERLGGIILYADDLDVSMWQNVDGGDVRFRLKPDRKKSRLGEFLEGTLGRDFVSVPRAVILNEFSATYVKRNTGWVITSFAHESDPNDRLKALLPYLRQLPSLRTIHLEDFLTRDDVAAEIRGYMTVSELRLVTAVSKHED